jgi:glycosyltransferase involved in cell wall biosynthesis
MRIGINIAGWANRPGNFEGEFWKEVLPTLAGNYPKDSFLLISDRYFKPMPGLPANCELLVVGPVAKNICRLRYWLDFRLPRKLKKHKVDILLTPEHASMRSLVPQVLLIPDLCYLYFPKEFSSVERVVLKNSWQLQIKKANKLITLSTSVKEDLVTRRIVEDSKIQIIKPVVSSLFRPFNLEEKKWAKDAFTLGKEYFLFADDLSERKNVIGLLKAFSLFKKRQQTGFKLVIAGSVSPKFKSFHEKLANYKYREDVVFIPDPSIEDLASLMGGAYALIAPSRYEGVSYTVLRAIQAKTPMILGSIKSMQEIADNAGLYFDLFSVQDLADKMMLLYKDETLRSKLISNGEMQQSKFSTAETVNKLALALGLNTA